MVNENIIVIDSDIVEASISEHAHQIRVKPSSYDAIRRFRDTYSSKQVTSGSSVIAGKEVSQDRKENVSMLKDGVTILPVETKLMSEASRAIKLRAPMFGNATGKSQRLYSQTFETPMVEDVVDIGSVDMPGEKIDISSEKVDSDAIGSVVDEGFAATAANDTELPDMAYVSPEEVSDVVGDTSYTSSLDNVAEGGIQEKFVTGFDGSQDVAFDNTAEEFETPEIATENILDIDPEELKNEISKAIGQVSRSESSIARVDKYDENGNEKVTTTEEDIDEPIYDFDKGAFQLHGYVPLSVPEMVFSDVFSPAENVDFTLTEAPIKTEGRYVPFIPQDRDGFGGSSDQYSVADNAASERITGNSVVTVDPRLIKAMMEDLDWLDRLSDTTSRRLSDAEKHAEDMSAKALEARRKATQIQADANQSLESFVEYYAQAKAAKYAEIEEKERAIALVNGDAKMNANFIEYQQLLAEEGQEMIDALESVVPVSHSSRSR